MFRQTAARLFLSSAAPPHLSSCHLQPWAHVCLLLYQEEVSRPAMKNKHGQRAPSPELVSGEHNGHLIFSEEGFRRVSPRVGISTQYPCQVTNSKREHLFEGMYSNKTLENGTGVSGSMCQASTPPPPRRCCHAPHWIGDLLCGVSVHWVGVPVSVLLLGDFPNRRESRGVRLDGWVLL